MATLRSPQTDLQRTPYDHLMSRCVMRSFLCGLDSLTGNSYDHRKRWLVDRIEFMSTLFEIDSAACCVLFNYYHLVTRVDRARADAWSDDEVLRHRALVSTQNHAARYTAKEVITTKDLQSLEAAAPICRARSYDFSWYMGFLNERFDFPSIQERLGEKSKRNLCRKSAPTQAEEPTLTRAALLPFLPGAYREDYIAPW